MWAGWRKRLGADVVSITCSPSGSASGGRAAGDSGGPRDGVGGVYVHDRFAICACTLKFYIEIKMKSIMR